MKQWLYRGYKDVPLKRISSLTGKILCMSMTGLPLVVDVKNTETLQTTDLVTDIKMVVLAEVQVA